MNAAGRQAVIRKCKRPTMPRRLTKGDPSHPLTVGFQNNWGKVDICELELQHAVKGFFFFNLEKKAYQLFLPVATKRMAMKSPEFHTWHNRSEAKSESREITLSLDFAPGYLRVQGCTVALTFQDSGGSEKVIGVCRIPSQGGNRSGREL